MKITQPVLLLSTSLASALLLFSSSAHASPVKVNNKPTDATAARRRGVAPPLFGSTALFADDNMPHAALLAPQQYNRHGQRKKTPAVVPRRLTRRTDAVVDHSEPAVGIVPVTASNTVKTHGAAAADTIPLASRRRRRSSLAQDAAGQATTNTLSRLSKRASPSTGDSSSSSSSLEPKGTNGGASDAATHDGSAPRVVQAASPPSAAIPPQPHAPSSSSVSKTDNASLILLPNPKTVWQAGSAQMVKWSRKYARQLPPDTTVDVVLVDARTNRKMHSLKRFIPFAKGSTSVWVPAQIQEGISYVLVLELYRGRSQDPVSVDPPSTPSSPGPGTGTTTTVDNDEERQEETSAPPKTPGVKQPSPPSSSHQQSSTEKRTILRRSEINIAHGSRKVPRGSPWSSDPSSSSNSNPSLRSPSNQNQRQPQHAPARSSNDNPAHSSSLAPWDHKDHHPYEFLPEEMRREFPGIDPPLDIEHTFGMHQIVVTKSPYTVAWKVPQRVSDWLEQAERLQQAWMTTPSIQAKVRVDLIKDQTMEVVSTLARNVPAQTMFMYLQVDDRLPIANYRLRVQMLVVEVPSTAAGDGKSKNAQANENDGMQMLLPDELPLQEEGWDFPPNSRIIDRYETVTRRFQVVAGAL